MPCQLAEAGRGWPRLEAALSLIWRWRGVPEGGAASAEASGRLCPKAPWAAVFHMAGGNAAIEKAREQRGAHGAGLAHLAQAHLGAVLLHVHLALRRHHLVVLA